MATFNIHQDPHEKENVSNPVKQQQQHVHHINKNQDVVKEKRSTLAVLSNIGAHQVVRGQQGKAAVFEKQVQQSKVTNVGKKQVFGNFQQQQKKTITSTTVTTKTTTEVTKTFVVYEDEQSQKNLMSSTAAAITSHDDKPSKISVHHDHEVPSEQEQKQSTIESTNISATGIRESLKDITAGGFVETPMSVPDTVQPMSVDKSTSSLTKRDDIENVSSSNTTNQQKSHKTDRIFEVDEYQNDILEYYKEVEKKHRPKPHYMKRQPDINNSMRTILVDWLVEVAEEYRLQTETLYLAISYVDRFLSYMSVVRAKLQLVGTAAMFIAAKYEEIYPPDVSEFVFITDETYTKNQVLRMEQIILKILSFDLNVPSPLTFLNMFALLHNIPDQVKMLAAYLSELTLLEGEPYLQYLPSQISSASLALARLILEVPMWSLELQIITGYSLDDLKELILNICRSHKASEELSQQAMQEKYKSSKYMQVSTIKAVELDEDQLNYLVKEINTKIAVKKMNEAQGGA